MRNVAECTDDELWESIEGVLERTMWERSSPPWYPPAEGSPLADADKRLCDFPMSPIVHMSVVVGRDHLAHARYLIRDLDSVSVGGPSALLRAALETVVMGVWVIRPDDPGTRMVRALRWHYLNLREMFRVQEPDPAKPALWYLVQRPLQIHPACHVGCGVTQIPAQRHDVERPSSDAVHGVSVTQGMWR